VLPPFLRGASGHACRAARPRGRGSPASPFEALRPWVCAIAAFAAPLALLWLGDAEALEIRAAAFGAAGLILLVFGEAPVWAVVLAALPLLQLAPGKPPSSLAGAMAAAGVEGPGTLALDPSALWSTLLVFAGCLAVFSLARAAGRRSASAAWWAAAAVAAFGCFEAATGARAADAATGTLVNRGQFAAMLEITFGVGCGLAAASWAGRSWRERFEERALLGGILGIACAASSLAGIALSLSRTGIAVGALAAFAAVLWLSRRRALMIAAAAVALLGLTLAAPPTLDRAHARFEQLAAQGGDPGRAAVWADSASLARQRLAFGAGLGSFPTAFRRSSFYLPRKSIEHAHSDYLEWLVELGAPGAALLLCSLIVCLGAAARRASGNPLAAGCVLGVGAVLVHAAVDLPLQHPGVAALAAAAAGLAAGLTSFGEKELRKPGVSTLSVGNAIARVYQRSFPLRNRAAGVNPRSAGPKPPAPLTGSGHETGSSAAGTRDPATLDADVKYGRRGF
jgi:O-antigen ligase